jgi:hypothetical protein
MLFAGLTLLAIGVFSLVAVGLLIYVIVNRIRQIDREKFNKRDN